jgi:hypothetical protein
MRSTRHALPPLTVGGSRTACLNPPRPADAPDRLQVGKNAYDVVTGQLGRVMAIGFEGNEPGIHYGERAWLCPLPGGGTEWTPRIRDLRSEAPK